jgi:hypothetical protein
MTVWLCMAEENEVRQAIECGCDDIPILTVHAESW